MKPLDIAIIDCGAGNLHSVRKAAASQLPEGATLSIVTEAAALQNATHIILPGVGAFADCMAGFNALPGMRAALEKKVLTEGTPFLGICVGMQMLFKQGYEHGTHAGLGWFDGEVRLIAPSDASLRIPHMGWNILQVIHAKDNFLRDIKTGDFVYFVHSYAATQCKPEEVLATVDYGGDVVALIGRENIWGTQFHPEKSQAVGLRMIHNFLGYKNGR
jgi:imidazole glycerol-phosphate synthase subunit HisH